MSDKKRKVPKLRFPGFTDAWEQRKLGEVGSLLKETVYPSKHPDKLYHEYSMPNYDDWKTPKVVKGNSMLSNRIKIKGNVLLINKLNVHQRRIWYVQTSFEDSVASGEFLPYISKEVNLEMLSQVLLSDSSTLDLISLSSGSSNSQKRITPEEFMKYNVMFPTDIKEQNMIAKLLNSIDKHISLHQRKLDNIKMLKKSLLQKLFPKDGEKIPELRFPGFTDAWEQRKLGEIARIIGGGTPSTSNPEYWDGGIDWYSPAEIGSQIYVSKSVRQISDLGLQKSSAKLLPEGSVLFTSRAGIGNTAILAKESCTNQGFQSIVPNKGMLDTYFIFSQSHALKKYGETVGAGSTFVEVSGKQMERMDISLPIIQEQEKIGAYFKQMDSLLSLHQRKLDHLKELKKGLLQQMFV